MKEVGTTLEELVDQGLLDAVADGLMVCDADGLIVAVNRRMEELAGYEARDMVGQPVEMLVPDSLRSQHESHRADFVDSGYPTRPMGTGLETHLLTDTGQAIPVDIELAALPEPGENIVVACIRDATRRVRQEHSMSAMKDVTEAILAGKTAEDIYSLICQRAVDFMEASTALIALRTGDRNGFEVVTAAGIGSDELVRAILDDPLWEEAIHFARRTVLEGDFAHLRGRLDLLLGPIAIFPLPQGQRLGFLLIGGSPARPAFQEEHLEMLENFAVQAGLAYSYGRSLRALAVAADRDRIARDLHDLVIQRVFAAGLSLQVVAQIHAEDQDLASRLQEVVASLDTAIAELRRSIFDLEKKDQLSFRDRVLIAVEEVLSDHEIATNVKIDEVAHDPPEEKATQLLATLREALTNAGRHSSASRVDISISIGSDLVLMVSDNGSGLPHNDAKGHGLANMAERAHQLGGELQISDSQDGGLELLWRVPI